MIGMNYEEIISKIKTEKGLSDEDISQKIEEKRNKLSGLVSKEGAAHILANELGIDLLATIRKQGLKITKLQQGMRVGTYGKVVKTYDVRSFNKNGREGKVGRFLLGDETGLVTIVCWDNEHIKHLESGTLATGMLVKVGNGQIRMNNGYKEMHLGNYSTLELNPEGFGDVVVQQREHNGFAMPELTQLHQVQDGQHVAVFATVVQVFEPRFYEGCSTCGKKPEGGTCKEHADAKIQQIPILHFSLDDGSATLRAVAFRDQALKLGKIATAEELYTLVQDATKLEAFKRTFLGEQLVFQGTIKTNSFFNNKELMVRGTQPLTKELVEKIVGVSS